MAVIGRFKASKLGGWEGAIQTLTIDRKVRLVPNDDRRREQAPSYIVLLGWSRIGEAWEARSRGETPRDYLRVQLNDPTWVAPLSAVLFPASDGLTAELVWNDRPLRREHDNGP
ncbi:DUF736 domain-containing protein [Brevundimonas aurantiaca]|uniref:DUF736 domain-containing protein n=1 Tax=Brevundimonas aurantiaca TaxID=74316 RepID=UPI00174DF9CC|nr:DUF736 family protein [Brevundimonas aurantiaca]